MPNSTNLSTTPKEYPPLTKAQIQHLTLAYQRLLQGYGGDILRAAKFSLFLAACNTAPPAANEPADTVILQGLYEFFDFLEYGEVL